MYVLIGIDEYIQNETHEGLVFGYNREPLATFDSNEEAEKYIEDSKTEDYTKYHLSWRNKYRIYKKKSLLYGYSDAEIWNMKDTEHNPKL